MPKPVFRLLHRSNFHGVDRPFMLIFEKETGGAVLQDNILFCDQAVKSSRRTCENIRSRAWLQKTFSKKQFDCNRSNLTTRTSC